MLAGKSAAVVTRGASADRFVRWGLKAPPSLYVMPFFKAAIEEEAKTCMRCGDAEAIPPLRVVLPGCISQISTLTTSERECQDAGGLSHVSHVGFSFFSCSVPLAGRVLHVVRDGRDIAFSKNQSPVQKCARSPGSPRVGKPSP